MKKIILSLLAAAALAACSKGDLEEASPTPPLPVEPDYSAPILPGAGIEATAVSRAPITTAAFPASTNDVFRITAYSGTAAPTSNWNAAYFADQAVNSGVSSLLAFATEQYYPANGQKLYFYAYAPSSLTHAIGTTSAAPTASGTIDGTQDIMAAQVTSGIAKASLGSSQAQPAFTFTHKLKQVSFKVLADATFETGKKVTAITIKDVRTTASLNVGTGVLTFSGTANQSLSVGNITSGGVVIPTGTAAAVGSPVMFETGTTFKVEVVADGVTFPAVEVKLSGNNAGQAGVSHVVTLTFKRNEIVPTAGITTWSPGDGAGADVV